MKSAKHESPELAALPAITPALIRDLGDVISDVGRSVLYSEGSTIFREGDPGNCAYVIEHGTIEVTAHNGDQEEIIAILEAGDLLGELATVDDRPRSATAKAVTEVQMIPVTREQIQEALENSSPIVGLLLRVTIDRLRSVMGLGDTSFDDTSTAPIVSSVSDDLQLQEARERTLERLKIERGLQDALELREFEVHYQPIVAIPEGRLVGFEALVRWFRPGVGYISPSEFIGPAEDAGLIVPIGLWVMDKSCRQMSRFQRYYQRNLANDRSLFVSVNLSSRQFSNATRVDNIVSTISRSGVDPTWLKLEMTESLLVANPEMAARGLKKLKRLGVTLAIDDFGTGYSSLSYLHRYPLDTLKIDRSFINALDATRNGRKVVQGIIVLAKTLEMNVVAEGVETLEQMHLLAEMGCDYVQGYLYSKPLAEDQVLQLLKEPVLQPGVPAPS